MPEQELLLALLLRHPSAELLFLDILAARPEARKDLCLIDLIAHLLLKPLLHSYHPPPATTRRVSAELSEQSLAIDTRERKRVARFVALGGGDVVRMRILSVAYGYPAA